MKYRSESWIAKVRTRFEESATAITQNKYRKACRDSELLTRPVVESMRIHGLSHAFITLARQSVNTELLATPRGQRKLTALRKQQEIESLTAVVERSEKAYPGLLGNISRGKGIAPIAAKHDLSRERARQLFKSAQRLAELKKVAVSDLVKLE